MQEQEQVVAQPTTDAGIDTVVLTAALNDAFVRHAIDNRGVLTSPRRGQNVAAQLVAVAQQYLAFEANDSDIAAVATQLAEQGMAIVTGSQMMRALQRTAQAQLDTAVLRRVNDFQLIFLEKLANAREIVQQRFQETSQAALQRALHAQLERQTSLHDAQKDRNDNLNEILQLNARLSQTNDEASLLRDAIIGLCQALDITHVTLYEAFDQTEAAWRVITTTAPFLHQGDSAPKETAALLDSALDQQGESVRVYKTENGRDGFAVGVILRVGQHLLGGMVANHENLDTEVYEEYLILVRTFAQNMAALWHNLYLFNQTQQRAHELEILHGRYLDSIWNTPEAMLQARADQHSLNIVRDEETAALPEDVEEATVLPVQLGDNQFGQVSIPGIDTLPEEDRAFVQDLIREMGSALNNAQFVQTTRAYSNQLRLAAEVSRAATTILDRDQLISEVVELIRSRFNLYYVGLFLVDGNSKTAVLQAGTGEAGKLQLALNHSQEIGGGSMVGTVIATGAPHVEQNIQEAVAFKANPLLPDTQAELAMPLKAGQKIIGALTVQSRQQGAFSRETITVLQSMADQLAIAIENADLFAQTQQNLTETNRLYAASRRIGQATNAYEIYKTLVDFAQASDIADVVQIVIADPKAPDYLITPVYWSDDDIPVDPAHRFPRDKYRYSDRITQTDVIILADAQTDPEIDPFSLRLFAQNGRHAAAIIPIYIDDDWLATLLLAHKAPNAFADASLQSIRTLADQAATILANQRLLRQTDMLYRIGRALNQAITRDDALGITVRELQTYTSAFQCRFVVYEPGEGSGKLLASSNGKAFDKPYHLPLLGDTIFERLSREQKPIKLSSKMEKVPKEAIQQHVTQFGADASLLIPAASQQELLGYLAIDALGGERPFTHANLQFAQTIVDHLTTQLENIKLLDEALHRAQELITLNQVQANISRMLDLSLLAETIYAEVGRLLDNTIFHLALYNPSQNLYEPIFTVVEDEQRTLEPRILEPNEAVYEFLNQSTPPQMLTADDPLVQNLTLTNGKRQPQSTLWVQLVQEGKAIGLITAQSYKARAYGDNDLQLLRSVGTQTSLAIANAQLFQQTQQQNEDLRELDQLKTQFLANMSHELRTPLNSIIGFSRIILKGIDGPTTPAQEEDLQSIHTNGQHLLMLINEILDMAKIEAGKMALNFETISLQQAINPVRDTMRSLINEAVDFVWDIPDDLPEIEADPIRLRQIVLNLLSNAAKFTDEGEIRLLAYAEDDQLHLTVKDSGIGIAPEDYDKLFTPFAQADSSNTRTTSGTGLGLPICKWLIETHQGTINFESKVNKGTTFYVVLPVVQSKEQPAEIPLAPSTIDLVS
ncbi:GAF domain-containing protein [Candidatus Leptofilum sp.]|uniref:GAF domain-containing protein n=1 Tax=Candidatus Leptofilum sp. TaxID=3241576 RepID=UPI003B5A0A0D